MSRLQPIVFFIVLISLAITVAGCASSAEETKSSSNDDKEFLHKYEKTFNPSDYDTEIAQEKLEEKKESPAAKGETSLPASEEAEIVSGFRVQVSFTDNIEVANQVKNELSSLLTDQTVYVVYEAPYYKVRVGDFFTRPEANFTLKSLIEKGYKDAWIVPDKVRKEPGH